MFSRSFVYVFVLHVQCEQRSWWNDLFDFGLFEHKHKRGSQRYRLLMQAVYEHRAVFLVDGVDEAGGAKEEIERAIADELLDQGHKTIVTSRHSGFKMESFERCQLVELLPMSHGQQEAMVRARLGSEGEEVVTEFMSTLQSSAAYTEIANIPVGD